MIFIVRRRSGPTATLGRLLLCGSIALLRLFLGCSGSPSSEIILFLSLAFPPLGSQPRLAPSARVLFQLCSTPHLALYLSDEKFRWPSYFSRF